MRYQYAVIIERAEDNYGAYVPDLPGCVAVGDTVVEVEANIRDAIALHLELMSTSGEPIPPATTLATTVDVTFPVLAIA